MSPENWSQIILVLILAVISAFGLLLKGLVPLGIEYLKSKIGKNGYDTLVAVADNVVRGLEQSPVFSKYDGAKKKELALIQLKKWGASLKFKLSDADYDSIIEAAVQIMNLDADPYTVEG